MAVRGWVQGCQWVDQGSELVAAAAAGASVLSVDWVGDFDDEGGTLRLNDVDLDYVTVDEDADTITLAAPLAAAATVGDKASPVAGGQVLRDYSLFVTHGEGDDAEITVPFAERDMWPEGEYDDPVEVLLSDDLERVEAVPGRTPQRDATFTYRPTFTAQIDSDVTIPHATWTTITTWTAFFPPDRMSLGFDGKLQVFTTGRYLLLFTATFAASTVGSRSLRMRYWDLAGGSIVSPDVKVPADGFASVQNMQPQPIFAGVAVSFEVWQNSGADLALLGATDSPKTSAHVLYEGPM